MACKTCDHTMQSIAATVWWCPRCGTLKRTSVLTSSDPREEWDVPKLVARAAEMHEAAAQCIVEGLDSVDLWSILRSVEECCKLPEHRG